MNAEQIALVKKPNKELSPEEYASINRIVAHVKRAIEVTTLIPGSIDELRDDTEGFIRKYKLNLDDLEALRLTVLPEYADFRKKFKADPNKSQEEIDELFKEMPYELFRYGQFISNKVLMRDRLRKSLCAPNNPTIKKWRERQVNRCQGSIGGSNESFIHAMVTYELAEGCSVGCEFCGLSAGRLKQVFRHTDENAELFRGVIKVCHEEIGDCAGLGMMYFATEPLDNPDYQQFEDDYYNEFHLIPQITTAVADRDIERTKHFVHELYTRPGGFIHRFTIRSLDMAKHVLEAFTPEELLLVELLPQFEEAPSFVPYTIVGKQARVTSERSDGLADPGTICCIDGFRINFPRKEVSIFTPCHMSEENPNGIAIAETVSFENAEDFRNKLHYLIDTYMVIDLPKDEPLKLYDYYVREMDPKYGNVLRATTGGELLLLDKFKEDYMIAIIDCLLESKYSKHEIAAKIYKEHGEATERTFYFLNQLWKKGFIVDTKFFKR